MYIAKDGYMETFVVNETSEDLWFDNLMVMSMSDPVAQETHYDPWGLELTGIGYEYAGVKKNKYLYNGKELIEDNGIQYYDYGARMYDPTIGRWGVVDPLADHPNQVDKSPYSAFWNNLVKYTDPDGRCPDCPDEVYVPLADHVYSATEGSSVNGWTVVKGGVYENTETGFKGALYQGSGEWEGQYIFATAGTDFTSLKDWQNNIQQITTGESPQYSQSVELVSIPQKTGQ